MLLKHVFILASIFVLSCASVLSYAASDTTQIKIGVVIKASSQCDYNYSSEDNSSNFNRYSLNTSCQMNDKMIQQQLVSAIKTDNVENQHYRVMMTVQ